MTNGTPPRPVSYDKKVGLVLRGGGALGSYLTTSSELPISPPNVNFVCRRRQEGLAPRMITAARDSAVSRLIFFGGIGLD